MMNMLSSRLLKGLAVFAAVLAPTAVFAQDTAAYAENASNAIGGLVIWLLPIGGIFAVAVAIAMDKGAQASRTNSVRR